MFNPFKCPIERICDYDKATPEQQRQFRIYSTVKDIIMLSKVALFFVPGLLICWLLFHWHGIALTGATIACGAFAIWLWLKADDWQEKRRRRNEDQIICDFVSRHGDYLVNVVTGERTLKPLKKKKRKKFFAFVQAKNHSK